MGRGRTTTGMVIASLLALRRLLPPGPPPPVLPAAAAPGLPEWFAASDRYPSPSKARASGALDLSLPASQPASKRLPSHAGVLP